MEYKYFDKNGERVYEGDYVRDYPDGEPMELFKYESEDGEVIGLGTDATNPIWIEEGRAVPCEYGIYPIEDGSNIKNVNDEVHLLDKELCGKN